MYVRVYLQGSENGRVVTIEKKKIVTFNSLYFVRKFRLFISLCFFNVISIRCKTITYNLIDRQLK